MKIRTLTDRGAILSGVIAFFTALNTEAALISWGVPTPIVGDTDVSLNGTLVYAVNFQGPSTSLNSVLFEAGPALFTSLNTGSASPPFTDLSAAYQDLLRNAISSTDSLPAALDGLIVGVQYELQLWAHDSGEGWGAYLWQEDYPLDNYPNAEVYVPGQNQGGLGSYVIGTFTADSEIQPFNIGIEGTWVLNATQLRRLDTTDIPEAGTTVAGLLLMIGTGGVWYRRRMAGR